MRKVGLAALEQRKQHQQQYQTVGGILAKDEAEALNKQLKDLQRSLEQYGSTNAAKIRKSPQLRSEFGKLCGKVGILNIEPSREALATRIIEVCRATRNETGGVISVKRLQAILGAQDDAKISQESIIQAVKSLAPLGPGMTIETLASSGVRVVRSTMHELSTDQADIIVACDALGFVSVTILKANMGWTESRAKQCLEDMVGQGLLWEDLQAEEPEYWSLGAFSSIN